MRVARVIQDTEELWDLLNEIKKLDDYTFIACLLGAYTGARFRELKNLKVKEFEKTRIHLGTQLYKGTGRIMLITDDIKPYIQEFYDKQPNKKMSVLERAEGGYLHFIEANRIVAQAAASLNLQDITITSFRKLFGNQICQFLRVDEPALDLEELVLDMTGFKPRSQTNLHTMFNFTKGAWE